MSDAASVVRSYVAAINARDYARAWDLGGRNLSGSYAQFVAGFAGTAHDTVRILGSDRTSASVRLEATQTDGSLKVFEGTYTVRDGTIVGADLHEVAGPDPSTDGGYRYFKNCAAAWDAGAAPIEKGEPGYAPHLDRDNDGVACEPYDDASP
ncbi:excalibur calcium-binding domain-containing protein [Streptomyces sp. NPDC050145]|uniref:excalibur calcium-binding domain-containing protein n=1 Tax=Streptomyces sp. NPDC050145 TaxID=3365602 RepID=UPI00379C53A7